MAAEQLKDILEMLNYGVVIGAVPYGAIRLIRSHARREAAERQRSYASLNDHFLKFLELELMAPGLGTRAGDRQRIWDELGPTQQFQQQTLLDYLCSILERAYYFLNADKPTRTEWEEEEWRNWNHWLRRYAENPNFLAFWRHLDEIGDEASYGRSFVHYVHRAVTEAALQSRMRESS